jgi:hypothetical protein
MSRVLASAAALPGGPRKVAQLVIAAALAALLAGCGLPAGCDVRAYDACAARHPQEAALCEGPRQAYEVDTSIFQARAAAFSAPALPARPLPPITFTPNG